MTRALKPARSINRKKAVSVAKTTVSKRQPATRKGSTIGKKARPRRRRLLKLDKPVLVQNNIQIGTDANWINAMVIPANPAWVAPTANSLYVWGQNDPNGPSAVIARRFNIRNFGRMSSATLFLAVDNFVQVFINGQLVVNDTPQATTAFFNPGRNFNIGSFLTRGMNDIVIAAYNFPTNANRSDGNPAGVRALISIQFN